VKGSNEAFEMLLSSTMAQLKKVEGDSFLPVDIRPNGRPVSTRFPPFPKWLKSL
jgi:hypothetical protein